MKRAAPIAVIVALTIVACEKPKPEAVDAASPTPSATAVATTIPSATASDDASSVVASEAGSSPCPADMAYVDTEFCPDIERTCTDVEVISHGY